MKTALISDIHGNILALEAVYSEIAKKGIVDILNLGDSLYSPLWPEETAKFIINHDIISILGNGDDDLLKNKNNNETIKYSVNELSEKSINWLKNLKKIYSTNEITIFHGCPDNYLEYFFEKIENGNVVVKSFQEIKNMLKLIDTKYIGCGHSHLERIVTMDNHIIINAGSVGLPAYFDDNPIHKIETHNNFTKYVEINGDEIRICYVEYDYKSASKQARKNNRIDWSEWIEYGCVID